MWLVYLGGALAALVPQTISLVPSVRRTGVVRAADGDDARPALSWQEELEKLLSPVTKNADRSVLLRDLISKGPEIVQEVSSAAASGDLASLVPPESTSRRVVEDIQAVQQQVVEDILPAAANEAALWADPKKLSETLQRAAADVPTLATTAQNAATALIADPEKAMNLAQQEARNTVSRTPEDLEQPPYTVLADREAYEVRRYDSYSQAATTVPAGAALGLEYTLRGVNILAAFFLGGNADGAVLATTVPLRTDVPEEFGDAAAQLSFMLPDRLSLITAPAPTDTAVTLRQAEAQTLATLEFTGLATDGEVRRRLLALRQALAADGVKMPSCSYALFQYNPPYTLPWLRRNEVAVPVSFEDDTAAALEAAEVATEDAAPPAAPEVAILETQNMEAGDADMAPSDVDDDTAADDALYEAMEAAEAAAAAEAIVTDDSWLDAPSD